MRWTFAAVVAGFLVLRSSRAFELLRDGRTGEKFLVATLVAFALGSILFALKSKREGNRALPATADSIGAMVGLTLLVLAAAFAPITTSRDPIVQPDVVGDQNLPPSLAHPFGTDQYSRDLFSRVVYGARVSLSVALMAVLLSITLGTLVGLTAGSMGGLVDAVLMRFVDAGLAVPRLFFLLLIMALWQNVNVATLVVVLGLTGWFGTSRLVRAEVLAVRNADYVTAARGLGFSELRIAFNHILPDVTAPIIVSATLAVGHMILIEAGLSYLGFGVQSPYASWGTIIRDGRDGFSYAPWIATIPGIAIALTVVCLGILGDRLQNKLNPRGST